MTFDVIQRSIADGSPIHLIEFSIGTTYWRYTTNDADYTWNGMLFTSPPGGVMRSNISASNDIRKQSIKITAARTLPFYDDTWGSDRAPSSDVLVKIWALHTTDPDQQAQVDWIGRIKTPSRVKSTVVFTCDPVYTGVQTQGLRRCFGTNCQHVLYGRQCGLNADDHAVPATILQRDGTDLTSIEFVLPDGFDFDGGFISWTSSFGYTEHRTIVGTDPADHKITLEYGSPELVPGLAVKAYPGCDHTLVQCFNFGNNENYGGQPAIPEQNPMDGSTPVF
jgi:uncharacterized phage protein (TIGR02218 family)